MQDIFAVFVADLGMVAGDGFLFKNDIIVELAAQAGHILGQGGDLLVDDQEDVFLGSVCISSFRIHIPPHD